MTEDSPSRMRGYGPFQEGAEPTAPVPAQPTGAEQPSYAAPAPSSGPPDPVSGSPQWVGEEPPEPHTAPPPGYAPDATPYPVTPTGMNPYGGYPPDPTSGTPTSAAPASGSPYPTSGGGYGPFRVGAESTPTSGPPDPYDFATPTPFASRRIEPSPPPDRSRLLIGIVAGLVAGLLVFGAGGWFAGRATAPAAAPKPTPTASPTPSLGVFEQSQVALNQPHFAATGLITISQGWLPYLSTCSRSGEPGGPTLNAGEKTRVRCTLDGMSAIFVQYNSISDRDKARVKTLGQNVDARTLTPGVAAATQRPTPSGRTNGNYVEYAYKLTEGGVTRPVAAVWWDDAQTPVAGYLLAYWKEGLGESWDPMRDLWDRYA